MAALARLGAGLSMNAGCDSGHRFVVAGVAFHFVDFLRVRIFFDGSVTIRAGKTSMHAGLERGALVVVTTQALGRFGRRVRRKVESEGER